MIVQMTVCAHCFQELSVSENIIADCPDHPNGEKTVREVQIPDPEDVNVIESQ